MAELETLTEGQIEVVAHTEAGRGFVAGVRDCLPVVLGYLAIGAAFGVVARASGLSVAEAALMSVLLYAGSAQFITVGLLASGASLVATVLTVGLVNIRHMFYSAALAPHVHGAPPWKNLLAGLELTDETFAVISSKLPAGARARHGWLYGVNLTAQATWVSATVLGAWLGQAVANVSVLGLDYALTAMFAALLVLQIANQPRQGLATVVGLTAAVVAVAAAQVMSGSWGLIVAAVVAATLGLAWEEMQP